MALTVNTNVSALNAQRATLQLCGMSAMERPATGKRMALSMTQQVSIIAADGPKRRDSTRRSGMLST